MVVTEILKQNSTEEAKIVCVRIEVTSQAQLATIYQGPVSQKQQLITSRK